jgi:hypothetical protein
MVNLVSTRAIRPQCHRTAKEVNTQRAVPHVSARRTVHADRAGSHTRVTELRYRKAHRDYSCVRVVAASAIVAGLLLGTAPLALAQVSQLIAAVPAVFTLETPSLAPSGVGPSEVQRDSAETGITVQHRLETSTKPSLISWNGTTQALKCSFSLLFDGNTRDCHAA